MAFIISSASESDWDNLVTNSAQGSIFSTTEWCKLYKVPYQIYGVYRNSVLVGGMIGFQDEGFKSGGYPFTLYQGVVVRNSEGKEVTQLSLNQCVAQELAKVDYHKIINHWDFVDIRPFLWAGAKPEVKYTYVVDASDTHKLWHEIEKDTRNLIVKANKDIEVTINGTLCDPFNELKSLDDTMSYKDLDAFYELYCTISEGKGFTGAAREFLDSLPRKRIFMAYGDKGLSAGAITVEDNKRGYFMFAATNPETLGDGASSLVLWVVLRSYREVDLIGANLKDIDSFKRNFGGKLKVCLGAKKED